MSEPELTPEQDERVRRLLAEARHDEPVPGDVAARLDRVLAELAAERAPAAGTAPVVDLAARRRRRNAGALLVAAAAVIVGGFTVGQVIDVGGGSSDTAGSAADSPAERASESAPTDAGGSAADAAPTIGQPLRLSAADLAADVGNQLPPEVRKDVADGAEVAPGPGALAAPDPAQATSCATAAPSAYGDGEFFPAYLDGVPAVLALRPPSGTTQRADVLACGTGDALASVELPAPR